VYWLGLVAHARIGSSPVGQVVGLAMSCGIGNWVSAMTSDDRLVILWQGAYLRISQFCLEASFAAP
jgi:hypothetical protein